MCRPQKDPLRELCQEERKTLEQFSRCLTMPADQVIHASSACWRWQTVTPLPLPPGWQDAKVAMPSLIWSPASIKKGFPLWKHNMGVDRPFATHKWNANAS
jgi:hypothetical protein